MVHHKSSSGASWGRKFDGGKLLLSDPNRANRCKKPECNAAPGHPCIRLRKAYDGFGVEFIEEVPMTGTHPERRNRRTRKPGSQPEES